MKAPIILDTKGYKIILIYELGASRIRNGTSMGEFLNHHKMLISLKKKSDNFLYKIERN
jgi:hypothetical protein